MTKNNCNKNMKKRRLTEHRIVNFECSVVMSVTAAGLELTAVPDDVLGCIFSFLRLDELLKTCTVVCKR